MRGSPQRFGRAEVLDLAHELRTPLTSLALAAGLLGGERYGKLSKEQRDLVDTITHELERLRHLVDRALRIERLGAHAGPLEREGIDLGELVDRVLQPLRAQTASTGLQLIEALDTGVVVFGDAAKLGWVAASLVGNALRFAPPRSAVRVRVDVQNGRCRLRVTDQGPGVSAERRRGIFSREGGGTLFLAREIVDAHGGELRLWSHPSRGATFSVTLPRRDLKGSPA